MVIYVYLSPCYIVVYIANTNGKYKKVRLSSLGLPFQKYCAEKAYIVKRGFENCAVLWQPFEIC